MSCECKLVGSLKLSGNVEIGGNDTISPYNGVITINISHTREVIVLPGGKYGKMPLITTINLSAYPTIDVKYNPTSCPVSMSANFKWTRIYDCDKDKYFYIYNKINNISYSGDLPDYITVFNSESTRKIMNASASSGPYSMYTEEMGYIGGDISYVGNPITFNTVTNEGGQSAFSSKITIQGFEVVLKSFSYNHNGFNETVNYVFEGGDDIEVLVPKPIENSEDEEC